ncbi:MAG: acyltransferase [Clostridia bacterium]|nr:acyltransferase [Clostridia bacterium]
MAKQRIPYIDLLKTIAIFLVITLHSGTWHTDFISLGSWQSMGQYCVRLFCEGVPIFMLINGFLMFDRPFDAKKHMRRTLRVVFIILLWSLIMDVSITLIKGEPLTLRSVVDSVLHTDINNSHTGVLWFLQKLVVVYLVFPVLKHLYDTKQKLFDYLLLVLMVSTYGINLLSLVAGVVDKSLLHGVVFFCKQYSLVLGTNIYVIYFMLGGYLYRNMETMPKRKYAVAGLVSAVLTCLLGVSVSFYKGATYSAAFNYSQIFLLFTVVGLFFVCSRLPLHNRLLNRALSSVGDNTMGIYLLHKIVIAVIDKKVDIAACSLAERMALSLLVLFVSWGLTVLIRKIPKVSCIIKL